jgi:hypothetical protein
MKNYVKKPVVVQAVEYNGANKKEIEAFVEKKLDTVYTELKEPLELKIPTLEGDMKASKGDYIIKGINGEFYPCKPDVFEKTYDVIENAERPQTFGEKAVGITFNPSGSDEVYEAKMLAAKQIDLLEKVHIKLTNDSANTSWVRNVLRTQAFNLLVSAQMALVKYLTWKD